MNLASEMQFEVENPSCSNMEIDEFEDKVGPDSSEKGDESKTSNVIFSRESPLICKEAADLIQPQSSYSLSESPEKKIYRYGRNQLGRSYHLAIISHNWDVAESFVAIADVQTLNHMLCMTLDFVWFLNTRQDFCRITSLIKGIVKGGASDFMRAMLRTAFLASCVSAYQSNLICSGEGGNVLSQRLKDRLKEYHGDDFLKAEASQKVQKFMEWALACISFHYRRSNTKTAPVSWVGSKLAPSGACEVQLRLSAFKFFLDLAGDSLSGKDFTEAFDAACFPLTLFSSLFDPGWSSGAPAAMIQGLLGLLVEWGADNVNQCFLEASRFGSTELVRILLQIARDNSLDVDVDLALGFASHYCRIGTMECLVEEGNATSFLGPLMRAAERGCMTVVRWFVSRGCRDMELCLALTGAASAGKLDVVSYLLPHVPQSVLTTLSVEILKSAGERTNGSTSFEGVEFLLKSDFLRDPAATYAVANSIACSDDKSVVPALREYLRENWSEAAFNEAVRSGEENFLNLVRVYARGQSEILLRDLPPELVVAIGYLPLYRECVREGGQLLPQKTRGHLVSAVRKLGNVEVDTWTNGELMAFLARYLPHFLI
ncbi:hypothetical protein LUZ61_000508 [Rhynchospora tenuis]|uniref:Ankyrin repeat protein SKIP35-like n=1 Tax=Rhynchospora tenuis TaxID=198213 RepID=A0AAD5ZFH5_9POAL|nr:hypothetical protein LUZ61_000508 [Rhynchospora tenuis]